MFGNNWKRNQRTSKNIGMNFTIQTSKEDDNIPIYNVIDTTNTISVIPLNIFQTWHTLDLPVKMRETVELLQIQNPEFTYRLYDDNMCREFIQNNFDEDVLYTFDKLKPGAYKSDLWRYCILYINGGIYLDVKYNCVNGFKLLELTDKEYYVRDRSYSIDNKNKQSGVYKGLLACLPNNKTLYACIQKIVKICSNNQYNNNDLDITGSHLFVSCLTNRNEIFEYKLYFNDNSIQYDNRVILKVYGEYRGEQRIYQKTKHYNFLWHSKDVYNYPVLKFKNKLDLSRTIKKNINGNDIELFAGTPTIFEYLDGYLINIRWINYSYNDDGSKKIIPRQWISLNSRFRATRILTADLHRQKKYTRILAKFKIVGFLLVYTIG